MAVGKMPFRGNDENELLWNVCYEQIHYPMFLTKELTSLLQLVSVCVLKEATSSKSNQRMKKCINLHSIYYQILVVGKRAYKANGNVYL